MNPYSLARTQASQPQTEEVGMLQSWLTRHERHRVTVEINGDKLELAGVTAEQQQRLIDAWVSRHTRLEPKG